MSKPLCALMEKCAKAAHPFLFSVLLEFVNFYVIILKAIGMGVAT